MPSVLVIPYPSAQIPEWVIVTHAVKAWYLVRKLLQHSTLLPILFFFSSLIWGKHWPFNIPLMRNIALAVLMEFCSCWALLCHTKFCLLGLVSYIWRSENCNNYIRGCGDPLGAHRCELAQPTSQTGQTCTSCMPEACSHISMALRPSSYAKGWRGCMASGPVLAAQSEDRGVHVCLQLSAQTYPK